jgi:catechol 2,3-dioxygenase-like lactoylglutathione lyase family enzyme
MSEFTGLAHIGLQTGDIQASKKFYMENLGFRLDYETVMDRPDGAWLKIAFVNLNGMIIELLESSDKDANKTGNAGCVDHLTIEVKNLPALLGELKAKGIVFETEEPIVIDKLFNGARIIFFRGPSGERLELFEFMG